MINDDRIERLEEKLDIVLLTMINHTECKPEILAILDRYKKRAVIRQCRRDELNNIKDEYFKMKTRIAEIESDYPNLVK